MNTSPNLLPAVFLDRDGTLIAERHYLHTPEEVEFIPGTAAALRSLQEAGFLLFIVTNQSGVGRGFFTLADVDRVHSHMEAELAAEDVTFDGFYVAPEAPDQPSRGRKPSPAFLLQAAEEHGLDLARSYIVGDKLIDLQTGWNAGCAASLLVRTGYGALTEKEQASELRDAVVVDDLPHACRWILDHAASLT
jgi:D-glycero-D-manno-heptose 1,7-bisphosphate phosphatase